MKLELDGIGASLRSEDGYTVVQNIIPGGAADKDGGLKPDDKIVGVGEGAERPDGRHRRHEAQRRRRRRSAASAARSSGWKSIRPTTPAARRITITRDRIELKDSEARSEIIERGKKPDGTPYRIGVIQLPSFYMDMDGARLGLADLQEHDPRRPPPARRIQDEERRRRRDRPPLERRRLADRGRQHDRPVHRQRPGRAGEGPGRPHAAVQGPGAGHGLGRPAGGDDQQVQRQRQRDLRRRDSGLRPRHRDRRPRHARQGHGAAAVRPGQRAVPHRRQHRTSAR